MPASVTHALAPGHELDDYRIESLLASGPSGLTYLAHDAKIDTRVVIREYLPIAIAARGRSGQIEPLFPREGDAVRRAVARFIDRSRKLAAVRHVCVVRVSRLFEANNTAYAVSDYETGGTLVDWRARVGRPTPAAFERVLGSALDGLAAMHAANVLHLDLRPSKIRMRADGTSMIVGNIGRWEEEASDRVPDPILQVTPGYAPLEMYYTTGKRGAWSDLYALAAIAYWLLAGERPQEAPARLLGDSLRRLAESHDVDGFSPGFLAALDWSLELRPDARPQDASLLRRTLVDRSADVDGASRHFRGEVGPAASTSPAVRPNATAWAPDAELLASAKVELARYLGPIAGVIVKKALADATDWRDFCTRAASQVPEVSARAAFLEALSNHETRTPTAPGETPSRPAAAGPTSAPAAFDPDMLASIEAELVGYLGAITRVVVKNAAGRARTRSELYEHIAAELDDPARGRKFVAWAESRFGLR